MRVVGTHRPRRGAPYRIYVSESGRELRRRRQRRGRRVVVVSLLVVIAAAVFVAGGWAQDLYDRFVERSSRRPTADAPSAPAASGVLIRHGDHGRGRRPAAAHRSGGDGVKVGTFLGDETRRLYGLGPPPRQALPHLEDVHRRQPDRPRPEGHQEAPQQPVVRQRLDRPAHHRPRQGQALPALGRVRPQAPQDRHEDRQDRVGVRLRRHHQEQSDGDPGPAPGVEGRQVPRDGRLPPRLAVGLHRPVTRPVPRRVVRHRRGAVAAAGAAHRELQPRRGRQRLLLQGPALLGGRERLVLQARPLHHEPWNGYRKPKVIAERLLLGDSGDASAHGGNLVLEASPRLLDDVIYVSSGAGPRVRHAPERPQGRLGLQDRQRPRRHGGAHPEGKLLVAVEKQYISGHGGSSCWTRPGTPPTPWCGSSRPATASWRTGRAA